MSDTETNEIENQVIEKLKKVIKGKSEKQMAHIEKLAVKKRGSKYKKIEPVQEIEEVKEEIEEKVLVKKEKKPVKKQKVIYESSSEEEEIKHVVKKKPKTKKKKVVYKSETESEPEVVVKKEKKPRQKIPEQTVPCLDSSRLGKVEPKQVFRYFNQSIC